MVTEQPQCKLNARFTPTEAAKTLGVSRGTIYNYLKAGMFRRNEIVIKKNNHITILGNGIIRIWSMK